MCPYLAPLAHTDSSRNSTLDLHDFNNDVTNRSSFRRPDLSGTGERLHVRLLQLQRRRGTPMSASFHVKRSADVLWRYLRSGHRNRQSLDHQNLLSLVSRPFRAVYCSRDSYFLLDSKCDYESKSQDYSY